MTLLLVALLSVPFASAQDAPLTLSQIAVAPDAVDGTTVTVQAAVGMIVTQKVLSYCPAKTTAVMLMPPVVNGVMQGAPPSFSVQACVDAKTAMTVASLPASSPIEVTGKVKVKRNMGMLTAMSFEDAQVKPVVAAAP